MAVVENHPELYEDLADHYHGKGEARQRDIFLVLAATAAQQQARPDESERLRARLMGFSPHHMFRPFPTIAAALESQDIKDFVADLRRQFPPDQSLALLQTLRGPGYQPKPREAMLYQVLREAPSKAAMPPAPARTSARKNSTTPAASPYDTFAPFDRRKRRTEESTGWLALVLFVIGLLAALAIAVWTLGRPFLPW